MISKRIKELRTEKDVTQRELANYLNLTPKMISFYESGERFPPHDIILKLSEYFNISTDYLLGNSNIKKTSDQVIKDAEKTDNIDVPERFDTVEEALRFILKQPAFMTYGISKMSEEEIMDIAENMLFGLKISLEKHKQNKGE
jgi:transcriptional regulator with XRE-family HTH domain